MTRRTVVAIAATLCASSLIATGCGSSASTSSAPATATATTSVGTAPNGEASKTAQQILADAKAAVASATTVHMALTHLQGVLTGLDLQLEAGTGGTGTLTVRGLPVAVIADGADLYVRAEASFWNAMTGSPATASLLAGHWVKVPPSATKTGSFSTVRDMADMQTFFATALQPTGTPVTRGTTTVNGVPAVIVADSTGVLYVALRGAPYPLGIRLTPAGGGGVAVFGNWNAPVTISPPSGSIAFATAA